MFPSITILGRDIPTYSIMALTGFIAVLIYYFAVKKNRDFPENDRPLALTFCVIGAFVGSKLLYILTILPQFISDLQYLFSEPELFMYAYLSGGYVFYGGVFGALAAGLIYCHHYRIEFWKLARIIVPIIPLFQGFGRIGCFSAGCCYGVESDFLGVTFTDSLTAPNGVSLFPVQLFESAGDFIIFFFIAKIASRPNSGRQALCTWLISYGIMRFFLEFLRGDAYRGFIGPLSTSQVIAIISIILGSVLLVRAKTSTKAYEPESPDESSKTLQNINF